MKNYLFAPFKDEEDKIESFSILKRYLSRGHKNELIMFIGRLESYYDVIINDLKDNVNCHIDTITDMDECINKLKADNVAYVDDFAKLIKDNDKLKAENKDLIRNVKSLNADNKRLYQEHKQCREDAVKHYPKEYTQEADEWFEHNPQDEKLFFFMVGGSGVDEDGDVINTLNVGADAIAECDNFNGVISVETYD